jgi:hypothetical protein
MVSCLSYMKQTAKAERGFGGKGEGFELVVKFEI